MRFALWVANINRHFIKWIHLLGFVHRRSIRQCVCTYSLRGILLKQGEVHAREPLPRFSMLSEIVLAIMIVVEPINEALFFNVEPLVVIVGLRVRVHILEDPM